MRKISLFQRAFLITALLFLYHIFCLFLFYGLLNRHYPYLLAGLLLHLAIAILYYFLVFLPYQHNKKLNALFLEGKIYEELFESSLPYTKQSALVTKKFHQLLNKQDAINLSKKQAEYLALQNQINPHFLYNTLEAIRGDALYAGVMSIAETTEALSSFFRYTITEVKTLVTLADELENAGNYFKIQQYRFDDKIKMVINFPENENEESVRLLKLPKLTLQPIIENAVFHGLEGKTNGGCITIQLETTNKNLMICISDNGLGIPEQRLRQLNKSLEKAAIPTMQEEKRSKGGIALRNVSQRIKLLFGEEYGLHIYSIQGYGTDVNITLPKIMD